jgi:signal transduction histidine kinase
VERSAGDRWVGGVCGGLSAHFGAPSWVFRVLFVATGLAGGVGLVCYALMWVFLPLETADPAGEARIAGRSWDITGMLGLVSLGLGLVLAASALGVPIRTSVWVPVLLLGGGVAVLWRQSDEAQRQYLLVHAQAGVRGAGLLSDRTFWLRSLVGAGLVGAGVVAAIGPRVDLLTGLRALAAAGAVVSGLALIALPWVSGWVKASQARRYAQIRAEERAAMAARVHDSVLQTLTLIQRRADDRAEVIRLARAEERALRAWLYAPSAPAGQLRPELEQVVAEAETDYEARVELVTVGDTLVDDRVAALLAATREAIVNAAKHSGSPITVYAEVTNTELEVNVRDRGCGFDPERVGADRHGVRESIIARTAGVGGQASVRSVPGTGTEVRLLLPLGGRDD